MDRVSGRLTVFFEEPFWVGVFERISECRLSVCRIVFGAEPKDYEVYDFVLKNYYRLRFSPAVAADVREAGRNPKRIQREVRKQVQNTGVGTKSQGQVIPAPCYFRKIHISVSQSPMPHLNARVMNSSSLARP